MLYKFLWEPLLAKLQKPRLTDNRKLLTKTKPKFLVITEPKPAPIFVNRNQHFKTEHITRLNAVCRAVSKLRAPILYAVKKQMS